MEKKKVLVVEDEFSINDTLKFALAKENFEVRGVYNGESALKSMEEFKPQLVLLDVMLPDISGFELCKTMSPKSYVVMLTARDDVIDRILGMEIGADDYITKPFENIDLVLKVKSHLRMNKRARTNTNGKIITIGEISLNEDNLEVTKRGKRVVLSTREYELLKYLMKNAGISLSKEKIFESVWGFEYGDIGTVAVNIKSLRDKLEDNNKYIVTIWGYGYKFVKDFTNE